MHDIKPSPHISLKTFGRFKLLYLCIIVALVVSFGAVYTNAAWDGSGSSGGAGGTGAVTNNDFVLSKVGIKDATGYRFSIYNGNGNKVGHSVDIMFEDPAHTYYRSYKNSKQSHIDLYKTYKSTGDASLGTLSSSDAEGGYVYYDDTIPALDSPPTIGSWLTKTKASNIAKLCGSYTFGSTSTHYIIVEPIFVAKLDGRWHALTMAEFAVYQANQAGSWTKVSIPEGGYMYNIGRFTSAVWGRYLYATGDYSVLGTSPVVESEHLTTDKNGTKTILLPNAVSSRNTAANILKYQVGMAVYTDVVPSYALDINGMLDGLSSSSISGFGTCDVYINGSLVANDVSDYYKFHPSGSSYEIKDIKPSEGKSYNGVSSGSLSGSITANTGVRLQFDTNTCTIKYNANGGSGAMVDITINQGDSVQIQENTFTRDGYTFTGWNTEADGTGTNLNPGDNYTPSGNAILYAIWVQEEVSTTPSSTGVLRFIQQHHLETLNEKSKWREGNLFELLTNVLSDNLTDITNCEQVWFFPAEGNPENGDMGFDEVKEWSLGKNKSTETNEEFLEKFKNNKVQ